MTTHNEPQTTPTESDENMAAWEAGVQRMKETLRARRPDLFDEAGELRVEEAMRLIRQAAEDQGVTLTELYDRTSRNFNRQADAS